MANENPSENPAGKHAADDRGRFTRKSTQRFITNVPSEWRWKNQPAGHIEQII